MNLKKLLLTGGTGFLGKNIMPILEKKYEVTTCGITLGNTIKTNLAKQIPALNQHYDIVLHAAGKAHSIPKNITEEQVFFEINLQGTINLCAALEKAGMPNSFIFISSVSVYGLDQGELITENDSLLATDPYGVSKIRAESLVQEWCKQHNVVCTILRLPLVVGANPPGNLGAMIKAIQRGYYFNIGRGNAKKSMVLAEDVARFIPIIAPVGGTYNLADGVHPSFSDLSNAIANKKINNLPLFVAKIMGYLGDLLGETAPINSLKIKKITSNLTFDDSKARSLGWKSQSVLEYLKNNDL